MNLPEPLFLENVALFLLHFRSLSCHKGSTWLTKKVVLSCEHCTYDDVYTTLLLQEIPWSDLSEVGYHRGAKARDRYSIFSLEIVRA